MKGISARFHYTIYVWSLIVFALLINWSHTLVAIMNVELAVCWLLQPNLIGKIKLLLKRHSVLLFSAIFILSIAGLSYTSNIHEGINQIKIVLPVFAFAVIFGTSPGLENRDFKTILYTFIFSTVASTFINLYIFSNSYSSISDLREISFFMSHIRYSLFILIAVFSSYYYLFVKPETIRRIRIALYISFAWLTIFLFVLQSITGIIIYFVILLLIILIKIYRNRNTYFRLLLTSLIFIIIVSITYTLVKNLHSFLNVKKVDISKLEKFTPRGIPYDTSYFNPSIENGHYVFTYVCVPELRESWNKRSKIPFDSLDHKKQLISFTMVRYLASKNLRKDQDGINALTINDITNIENGFTNYKYINKFSIDSRIYQIIWEIDWYLKGGNPQGNSLTQRFEFWRCAFAIIEDNFWFGVGTGDVRHNLNVYYSKTNSRLQKAKWFYPHNQYLTTMVRFGFFGLFLFILSYISAVLIEQKQRDYFVFLFTLILFLSMINEDTLETQHGIVFFAFWGAFFLFSRKVESNKESQANSITDGNNS